MNWLKDNLIMILAIACGVFAIGWTIDHFRASARYARQETKYNAALTDVSNLRSANDINLAAIDQLKAANKQWEEDYGTARLDARSAGLRAEELGKLLTEQNETNRRLREELAKENPNVAAYLDDGMPCELAQQLWGKQAGYC